MNILLVNPYITDFSAYDLWLRPMGLYSIATVLQRYTNCTLYWLDTLDRFYNADEPALLEKHHGRGKYVRTIIPKPDIYSRIPRHYYRQGMPLALFWQRLEALPDMDLILLTSLMTYWHDGLVFTVNELRRRFPQAQIVIGGVLPTLALAQMLRLLPAVTYVQGQGESQVLDIVAAAGGRVFAHADFKEIDNIPFPALEFGAGRRIAPMLTARGCPLHCHYCASRLLQPHFQERKAEAVLEELHCRIAQGASDIVLFDDALLVHKQTRFFPIFTQCQSLGRVRFHTPNGLHAREIDAETASLLVNAGFVTLRLSFEALNADLLRRSSGKVTMAQMQTAVDNLVQAGFPRQQLEAYLLFGYPGQTRQDMDAALSFVSDLGIVPHLADYSPVPGTVDYIELQKAGILSTPGNLHETNKTYYVYEKSGFSADIIAAVKERCLAISRVNRAS